ncbi:MAG: hypothetical protein LBL82_03150 [Oscillospiraceae bacterium]|jgi:hypothetical protein|nr:hypothetical protein [Oscillospiraceae bacterium]
MKYYQIAVVILFGAFYITYIAKMLLKKQGIKGSILGKNALEKALLLVT